MRILALSLALGLAAAGLRADARAEYLAAVEHHKAGRWPEAAQGYARVTAQLPSFAPAWKQLSVARFHMGDHEGSMASADRYLALEPKDQAFAAWVDQTRARLKLPPRATPLPTPGPPTPTPQPTPEGLLYAAPPPGADAQILAPEAAAAVNTTSATELAALEAQEARRAKAQMAAESAAILRGRAVARTKPRLGLRLLGGLGAGLGRFEHGEAVDSHDTPSTARQRGAPAGGGLAAVELGLGFGERLELGLGAYPLLWQDQRKSSRTGGSPEVSRISDARAEAAFVPLLLSLTWKQPLSPGLGLLLGGGAGAVPSARVTARQELVQTHASGLSTTASTAHLDYGLAPAWRLMAGGSWSLGARASFEVVGQALGAAFSDAGGSAEFVTRDENGTVLAEGKGVPVQPQALQVLSLGLLAGVHLRF